MPKQGPPKLNAIGPRISMIPRRDDGVSAAAVRAVDAATAPVGGGAGAASAPGGPLRLRIGACCLPHPDKAHYGGEDAHFVSAVGGGALGVADGVGGWADSGVNPAEYSRSLMTVACAYLEGRDAVYSPSAPPAGPRLDPRGALDTAHRKTRLPGSATACVVQLDAPRRALRAANLGDSGFIVARRGAIAARSAPLQHFFDCPFQFGAYPEYVEATDTAEQADAYDIAVEPGDVIVAASDGLWDNAFDKEILGLLPRDPSEVEDAASRIAALARRHAADAKFSPPEKRMPASFSHHGRS